MIRKLLHISVSALLATSPFYFGMTKAADEHSAAALQHAIEAARSKDSQSVGEHAEEALKHIEEGKESASSKSPEEIKHTEL